jgi:hypothetical protein
MSQQFETGHAKNVANLEMLIEQIKTFSNYNPSIDNLKIPEITTLYNNALASLNNVKSKRIANKNAIHTRQDLYIKLKSTSTRIINQLDILNLKEGVFNQAKSLNKLIQGSGKTEKEADQQNSSKSTSRQSYTQLAENFSKILQQIATISTYNPNIDDLKLVYLYTYQTELVNITQIVNQTEAELDSKIIERNSILYDDTAGLYEIAQNVKKYVKSVYGATSPEYSNVSKIKFTDLRNR